MDDAPGRIIRGMRHLRHVRPLAWILIAAGVGFLVLSLVLEPTPTTYVLINKHRTPVTHDNAVDYAIGASRILGVALLIAGTYLGYRSARPDAIVVEDGMPPSTHTQYSDLSAIHGD